MADHPGRAHRRRADRCGGWAFIGCRDPDRGSSPSRISADASAGPHSHPHLRRRGAPITRTERKGKGAVVVESSDSGGGTGQHTETPLTPAVVSSGPTQLERQLSAI